MIDYLLLAQLLQPYRVTRDQDMPWPYQVANPQGRPYHDDWPCWPLTRVKRMDTAYRVPYPFRKKAGNAEPVWTPNPNGYPVERAETKEDDWLDETGKVIRIPWVLTMQPVHAAGQWSVQEAWIGGAWVECYRTASYNVFGNRLTVYRGLRLDPHPRDAMCWFPEASGSVKWGRLT